MRTARLGLTWGTQHLHGSITSPTPGRSAHRIYILPPALLQHHHPPPRVPPSSSMLLLAALLAGLASAHMQMAYPPPLRSKHNPHSAAVDYSMSSPLLADGSNFPCKGYQADLGSPAGRPTAAWSPGGTYNLTLEGTAVHAGGSCQVALSYDRGASWAVLRSFVGGCPLTPTWSFELPPDAPAGEALFAWSWFNKLGNREMYMNCAAVTVRGGGGTGTGTGTAARRSRIDARAGMAGRPALFVANVGNGCATLEGKDVAFPHPGPDVEDVSGGKAAPVGRC
ncbi:uncharacterized protein UV8b_07729 [Ustilaginoidea virens]|uniref:Extracellular protein n=1 Tax=Ustilaginoidea virens TaxID=1159556 RepID=A0A8E5HXT6_USTVR|nr:uncharacterized protein UV8b_07729 [Ustilaginoidea virens]QUC23488.1 hypothetical protein UV8b_07729 [Ustilaginoidea virens]